VLQIAGVKGKDSGALRAMGRRPSCELLPPVMERGFPLAFHFGNLELFRKTLAQFDSCNRASLSISPW
jgi:hypothetical protein